MPNLRLTAPLLFNQNMSFLKTLLKGIQILLKLNIWYFNFNADKLTLVSKIT